MDIPESYDLVMLDPAGLHFREEAFRLQMRPNGDEEWLEVQALCLFPLSEPYRWISIQNEKDDEFGILEDLRGLPAESAQCVRSYLQHLYLVPQITRIISCRTRMDIHEWVIETNRGRITFLMRHLQESIKQLLPGRYALLDVEGNRYDVVDITVLDPESRAILEARI